MRFSQFPFALGAAALLAACGADSDSTPAETSDRDAMDTAAATPVASANAISAEELAAHIETLSSDAFEGRAPTTPGGEKTRDYIAKEYERLGLTPIGDSYFQRVPMVETTLDPDQSYFKIVNGESENTLKYKTDIVYWTKRVAEELTFDDSELVFVGYGIVAPEYNWNDYDGVDVAGKTVVMLVNDPGYATQNPDLFNGNAMTYYGRWTYKYEEAGRQGAAAALIIHETAPAAYGWNVVEGSWSGPQLDLERPEGGDRRAIAEGWISLETAQTLFDEAGLNLAEQQEAAAQSGFKAAPMTGLRAAAKLHNTIRRSEDANVIGVLEGAARPDEYVVYMGHWDHLGVNPTMQGDDKIFNGAVDNATGIASILEIAEAFATAPTPPQRSILFAAVTAEESGLLGSVYMAEDPPTPLKNIVGGINIDAILPTAPSKDIVVVGHGASELEDILKTVAGNYGAYIRPDPEPEKGYFYRSDHISLAKKGVPMLYADSGFDLSDGGEAAGSKFSEEYRANRYHGPADEYSADWNMDNIVRMTNLYYDIGNRLANSDEWPNWYEGNEFRALRDEMRDGN